MREVSKRLMALLPVARADSGTLRQTVNLLNGLARRGLQISLRTIYSTPGIDGHLSPSIDFETLNRTDNAPRGLMYSEFLAGTLTKAYGKWVQRSPTLFEHGSIGVVFGDFPIGHLIEGKLSGLYSNTLLYSWGLPALYAHFTTGDSAFSGSRTTRLMFQMLSPLVDREFSKLEQLDAVIPVTEWMAHLLSFASRTTCTAPVPNAVDTEVFKPSPSPPEISGRYVLAVGLSSDVDFRQITDIGKRIRVVKVGKGDVPHCKNLGFVSVDRLINLYTHAEYLLWAPTLETSGMIPVECMACGTPVLSVPYPGAKEFLPPDNSRYVVPNVGELRKRALELWSANRDQGFRKELRDYIVRQFGVEPVASRFIEVLNGVCSGDSHPT